MYSLIYRSRATPELGVSTIKQIHKEAVQFNSQYHITGCLLHHQGKFVQLIEGSREAVTRLFEKIKKDRRHTEVQVLNTQHSSNRMFADWSMIFDNIDVDFSNKAIDKKKYFESIFHSSNATSTPGKSKFELWRQANNMLIGQNSLELKQFKNLEKV